MKAKRGLLMGWGGTAFGWPGVTPLVRVVWGVAGGIEGWCRAGLWVVGLQRVVVAMVGSRF